MRNEFSQLGHISVGLFLVCYFFIVRLMIFELFIFPKTFYSAINIYFLLIKVLFYFTSNKHFSSPSVKHIIDNLFSIQSKLDTKKKCFVLTANKRKIPRWKYICNYFNFKILFLFQNKAIFFLILGKFCLWLRVDETIKQN